MEQVSIATHKDLRSVLFLGHEGASETASLQGQYKDVNLTSDLGL